MTNEPALILSREDALALCQEAHTQGRIYARMGEKATPSDEYERLEASMNSHIDAMLTARGDV